MKIEIDALSKGEGRVKANMARIEKVFNTGSDTKNMQGVFEGFKLWKDLFGKSEWESIIWRISKTRTSRDWLM